MTSRFATKSLTAARLLVAARGTILLFLPLQNVKEAISRPFCVCHEIRAEEFLYISRLRGIHSLVFDCPSSKIKSVIDLT